ncbi:Leucine rich repeat protein [Spraguea lophii 42_110]|uniref:Leucine rich repeat protein n=1 Tax=Spraguea lophii (strain 42_110) TaxID=1358809 RepID=S7WDJ4_SPRLO|nr:Leucine rich repeat protein [Spraguea lophii 42_110]
MINKPKEGNMRIFEKLNVVIHMKQQFKNNVFYFLKYLFILSVLFTSVKSDIKDDLYGLIYPNEHSKYILNNFITRLNHTRCIIECNRIKKAIRIDGFHEFIYLSNAIGIFKKMKILQCNRMNLYRLPNKIKHLNNLVTLDISINSFLKIPKKIISLKKLKHLNMYSNMIEEIPGWISNMTELEIFNIGKNKLKSMSTKFFNLKNLQEINFSENYSYNFKTFTNTRDRIKQNIYDLFRCSKRGTNNFTTLKKINFNSMNLSVIPDIFVVESLVEIDISNNYIKHLPEKIYQCKNLIELNIAHNGLHELSPSILGCKLLETIDAQGNFFECFPVILFKLRNLLTLSLSIDWNVINLNFNKLEILELVANNLDELSINCLRPLPIIQLSITGLCMQKIILHRFDFPELKTLIITTGIAEIEGNIYKFEKLEALTLEVKNINSVEKTICKLENLRYLYIKGEENHNINTRNILVGIRDSKDLSSLILKNCCIEDIPLSIFTLKNLTTLNLSDNKISEIPTDIQTLTNLKVLILSSNNICQINSSICNYLGTLTSIDIIRNSIKMFPLDFFKSTHKTEINADMNSLKKVTDGRSMGFFDLPEKYLLHVNADDLRPLNKISIKELYNAIEYKKIKWDIQKLCSIKHPKLEQFKEDFEYIKDIWYTKLEVLVLDAAIKKAVWDYIKAIYGLYPDNTHIEFLLERNYIDILKTYVESIFRIFNDSEIDLYSVNIVFPLIFDGIFQCHEGQKEALRTAYLYIMNELGEEKEIKSIIYKIVLNIKENILRKITTSQNEKENVHIFSYWKKELSNELGFYDSNLYTSNIAFSQIYNSRGYIIYKFLKAIMDINNVVEEITNIINQKRSTVCLISEYLFKRCGHDYETYTHFVKYNNDIVYLNIEMINAEGTIYLLKDLGLLIEQKQYEVTDV